MKNHAFGTGIGIAVSATALSVVCALFLTYGYPWLSLAWAALACAAVAWLARGSFGASPSMSEVITGVEGESAPRPGGPERAVVPTTAAP